MRNSERRVEKRSAALKYCTSELRHCSPVFKSSNSVNFSCQNIKALEANARTVVIDAICKIFTFLQFQRTPALHNNVKTCQTCSIYSFGVYENMTI